MDVTKGETMLLEKLEKTKASAETFTCTWNQGGRSPYGDEKQKGSVANVREWIGAESIEQSMFMGFGRTKYEATMG